MSPRRAERVRRGRSAAGNSRQRGAWARRLVGLAGVVAVALGAGACPRSPQEEDPKAAADGHYLAGRSAYLRGDSAAAHKAFEEVHRLSPEDPRLPVAVGELLVSEGRVAEAITSFEDAARREPKRPGTFSRLAYLYALKGEREKAREALERALALNPKEPGALETRGDLALKEGKLDDAVASYVEASASAPEPARAELVLRAAGLLAKKGRGEEGRLVLEAAVGRGIRSVELSSELGDRFVEAGELERALGAYTDAAKLSTSDPTLWELVGELEAKRGRAEAAEAAFKRSLAVKDRAVVHVALARLCRARSDAACVKAELDTALARASGEEAREALELAALLTEVDRKRDALLLLANLSDEEDQRGNRDLQLRVAALAQELGEAATVQSACRRAMATKGPKLSRCPAPPDAGVP